jgi:16S rRNA (guanine(527)-N(7))-methyltransferase RsmG
MRGAQLLHRNRQCTKGQGPMMSSGRRSATTQKESPGLERMQSILEACGLFLTPPQLQQLWSYHQLLRQHNPELNLTRIHNFSNMVLKLYVDSMLPAGLLELPSPLLDLGTGPGMPGIPLKVLRPDLELLLAESRQKRVAFLEMVCNRLHLQGVRIIGQGINASFTEPVAGVITRAVATIPETLARIRGCLPVGGRVIFMKGPQCDAEIALAINRFHEEYQMDIDQSYCIPHTPHERRLVVFSRAAEAGQSSFRRILEGLPMHKIESEHNELFKEWKKLLGSRGIKKQQQALICGPKQVRDALRDFPERCAAWISAKEALAPPANAPQHLHWYQLAPALFQVLDALGTHAPLLLMRIEPLAQWRPDAGLPPGCSLLVPFQDPENVGAVIRSAVAFGATQIILLAESAHPYHPKAIRASGGAVLHARLLEGPALKELPPGLPIIALSPAGQDIEQIVFPETCGLLPGLEGPGLPEGLRDRAAAIPMSTALESLNAATATAIALYVWSRRTTRG